MYVQGYTSNKKKVIGSSFPEDNMIDIYYNIYNNHKVTGDKLIVLKTKIAKEYYFSMIDGEKFVPEALIFSRISLKYRLLCKNTIAAYKEYLEGGYSNNYFNDRYQGIPVGGYTKLVCNMLNGVEVRLNTVFFLM